MNLFLRVGLCIHFPNFQRKTRQLLILVYEIITVILQIYFQNLKTCKNTSFGFTESQITRTADVANSKKGSYKFTFQIVGTSCVAPLRLF